MNIYLKMSVELTQLYIKVHYKNDCKFMLEHTK